MGLNHSSNQEPRPAATEKMRYEKPSFRCEEVFVTTALTCGKISPSQSGCALNTKVS